MDDGTERAESEYINEGVVGDLNHIILVHYMIKTRMVQPVKLKETNMAENLIFYVSTWVG